MDNELLHDIAREIELEYDMMRENGLWEESPPEDIYPADDIEMGEEYFLCPLCRLDQLLKA